MDDKLKQLLPIIGAAIVGIAAIGAGFYFLNKKEAEEEVESPVEEETPVENEEVDTKEEKKDEVAEEKDVSPAVPVKKTESAPVGPVESISKETLKEVLTLMIDRLVEIKEATEKKKIKMEKQGKSNEQIEEVIQNDIQTGLQAVEDSIQKSHGVNQYILMDAQNTHASDPEVAELIAKLRSLFFGEEGVEEMAAFEKLAPADMTAAKFYDVVQKHMAVLDTAFEKAITATAAVTKNRPPQDRLAYLEFSMQRDLPKIHQEAMEAAGLTEDEFKGCMIKFGNDQRIMELVISSQMKQDELKAKFLGA